VPSVPESGDRPESLDRIAAVARPAVWIGLATTIVVGSFVYAHKATEERSAIVRWLPQVEELQEGVNIWHEHMFPTPPIFPISLFPLTTIDPVAASLVWYYLRAGLTVASILMCFRMARQPGDERSIPAWVQFGVVLLSIRPVLSDLHHGNNNLVILFLVVSSLYAWRNRYDALAGLALGLAITYKVTPALFVPFFLYKRQWRVVVWSFLSIGVFLVVVPSLVLGPSFNGQCLYWWWHRMLRPFVMKGEIGDGIINQSMAGVVMRLFTEQPDVDRRYAPPAGLNLLSLRPEMVSLAVKIAQVGLVGLLAWFCRFRPASRIDRVWLGQFSLVVLTMLFVSERSWKHHYITVLLPYSYLVFRVWLDGRAKRWGPVKGITAALALSALLMLTTSTEVGELAMGGNGHKLAQYYGMFLWSGVVLYVTTVWVLRRERSEAESDGLAGARVGAGPHWIRRAPGSGSTVGGSENAQFGAS